MATTVLEDPSGYGRVVRDADGAVERVVETKEPGDATQAEREIREVNTGIFVFAARPLRAALPRLTAENAQGELYLPQVLEIAPRRRRQGRRARSRRPAPGARRQRPRCAGAVRALAQEAIHARHMRAGVTIVDPAATVIDVDVEIGEDTVIEPFTTIRGATRIGRELPDQAARTSSTASSRTSVSVGPFAYLRPGTVLRAGAKVGTFVEVKNSDIGPGVENPASLLHRRRRRGRAHEPRRGDDHGQLRRPRQAPHDDRRAACATSVDTTLRRARDASATAPTPARAR